MKKLLFLAVVGLSMTSNTANAQGSDPYLGQIAFVGFNFAPNGWAECNGQLLSIAQNSALFSLLGTTYGGNGQTTFALPDMRGRMVIHAGQGPGLTVYSQGEIGGQENVTLTTPQIPAHSHGIVAVTDEGNQSSPTNNLPANTKTLDKEYSSLAGNTTMKSSMVSPTGGSQPHENRSPFLTLKCIIALQGIYPSRP
ncbi:phage tail protein [Chryseobacterium sp. MP_3.2]|uniref:phage tail protein n=1 Tax=Chryseobacterium sp. MP_3.2 TaxID=3071712 RepID=UPI002DF9DC9B|nr:microcystin-dependent protein [Chryseobacterium sp. MP_3.2]